MQPEKRTGIELIAAERARQYQEERWTEEHDDEHTDGQLALAAICYASPVRIFSHKTSDRYIHFKDPWPWTNMWDKRLVYGEEVLAGGYTRVDPQTFSHEERLDLLVKAGALIAAEIDRLQRAENSRNVR